MSVAERTRLVHHVHERWETIAHAVPHVKQTYNWDCGLACVLMVVRALGASAHHCDLRTLRQLCRTTSIWTVDLAYLLRRFGADVTFTTVTARQPGVRVGVLLQGQPSRGLREGRRALQGRPREWHIHRAQEPQPGRHRGVRGRWRVPRDTAGRQAEARREAPGRRGPPGGRKQRRGGSDRLGWLTGAAGKPAAWGTRRGSESASTFANGTAPSRGYTGHYIVVWRLQSRGRRVPVQGPGVAR